jgi:hypothetical protein
MKHTEEKEGKVWKGFKGRQIKLIRNIYMNQEKQFLSA